MFIKLTHVYGYSNDADRWHMTPIRVNAELITAYANVNEEIQAFKFGGANSWIDMAHKEHDEEPLMVAETPEEIEALIEAEEAKAQEAVCQTIAAGFESLAIQIAQQLHISLQK